MVFVTVGNASQPFDRLLAAAQRLAEEGFFEQELVFLQTGTSSKEYPSCETQEFLLEEQFESKLRSADIVISHGGSTPLRAIRLGKVPVVMPRRKKYGEHVNDHQLELVELLANDGRVVAAYEPKDLPDAIQEARRRNPLPIVPSNIVHLVSESIDELIHRSMANRRSRK